MAELKFDITEMAEGFAKAAKERGLLVGKWIPVSERLPEEAGTYLCSYDDDYVGTSYFDISMNEFNIFHEQVTAWMPLPLPYKQEAKK